MLVEENRKKKKTKWKRPPNPKKGFFKVVMQKWEMKNGFFRQNLPDIIVSIREKNVHFVHTICFGPKILLDQNSENQEKF